MAKIKMAQVAGLPVRTLRRMVGIPAHRPSAFNACIGAALEGKGQYPKPPKGTGGQNDKRIQAKFKAAVQSCKGK